MILDEICALSKKRASEIDVAFLKDADMNSCKTKNLLKAIRDCKEEQKKNAVIAEIKYRSPSDKTLSSDRNPEELAGLYKKGGACAISVLTEPFFFNGNNRTLSQVKCATELPVLRKDFIVDEKQVLETSALKADSVLLISDVLQKRLESFISLCRTLSLEPLVEVRTLRDAENAIKSGAELVGINNRNLKDMTVGMEKTRVLSGILRDCGLTVISESGIKTPQDITGLKSFCDGFLIGTALMKTEYPDKALEGFVFA